MRVRKLSPSGDYTFGNSQQDFYRDEPDAVGQLVGTTLRLWLGEFYWDLTQGVPYMQGVLGKHSKELADATIQAAVLDVEGVSGITDGSYQSTLDPVTRAMDVSFQIDTIYGTTEVQLANYLNY